MAIDTLLSLALQEKEKAPGETDLLSLASTLVRNLSLQLHTYANALTSNDAQAIVQDCLKAKQLAAVYLLESFTPLRGTVPVWCRRGMRRQIRNSHDAVRQFLTGASGTQQDLSRIRVAQDELLSFSAAIERAQIHRQWSKTASRAAMWLIALVGVCGGALAAFYLGLQTGLEPMSTEVLLPHAPFRGESAEVLSSAPEDLSGYFAEFSPYYFGRSNSFPAHYNPRPNITSNQFEHPHGGNMPTHSDNAVPDAPAPTADATALRSANSEMQAPTSYNSGSKQHHELWRVILSNRSPYRAQFVGTVRVELRLTRQLEFPWNLLNVTPNLLVKFGPSGEFSLINSGVGPALDISVELRTRDGLVLRQGQESLVHDMGSRRRYLDLD